MCAPVDGMAGPGQGKKFPGLGGVGLVPNIHPGLDVEGRRARRRRVRARRSPSRWASASAARSRRTPSGAFDRVALAGLTNSYFSYTATPEEYDACHYEGSFTLFGRRQGARLLDVAKPVSAALLAGSDAPAGIAPPALGVGTTAELAAAADARRRHRARAARRRRRAARPRDVPLAGRRPVGRRAARRDVRASSSAATASSWETVLDRRELPRHDRALPPATSTSRPCSSPSATRSATYRFVVTGRADKGDGVEPYSVTSRPFELDAGEARRDRAGRAERARERQGDLPEPRAPGRSSPLPRLVRTGTAMFRVGKKKLRTGTFDAATATASVPVEDGQSVELVASRRLRERCA